VFCHALENTVWPWLVRLLPVIAGMFAVVDRSTVYGYDLRVSPCTSRLAVYG
jgi:hypothetical protein